MPIHILRSGERFYSDNTRVVTRFFHPGGNQSNRLFALVQRVMSLDEVAIRDLLQQVLGEFGIRHRDLRRTLADHARRAEDLLPDQDLSASLRAASLERRLALGAYLTMEYSVAAAALFNPSLVPHPDQSGLPSGTLRVVMSLRAVGEGHQSSLTFRGGLIDGDQRIVWNPPGRFAEPGEAATDRRYDLHLFGLKLVEAGLSNSDLQPVLSSLPDGFARGDLEAAIGHAQPPPGQRTVAALRWLADSNYEVRFPENTALEERVLLPMSANDRNGIEDARFVRFVHEDGTAIWYATYTAFSGTAILPQLIETVDFRCFRVNTLNGRAATGKGMALFPRQIGGAYWMLGREDGENLTIMRSDHLHFWQESTVLLKPSHPWDLVLVGNCGSPIEIAAGWLVITHGVGPLRRYVIGALLLDRDDPKRVIARLEQPLIEPLADERFGYVPNVLYSCGGLVHQGALILPYAMSDSMAGVAQIDIEELLGAMTWIS